MPRFSSNFKESRHHAMPKIRIPMITWLCVFALIILDCSIYTTLTLIAAALHEAGHIATAILLRADIKSISIYPLGADIRMAQASSYLSEIIITSAGIAANLIFFVLSRIFFRSDISSYFAICNLSLAIINAIPINSLDGGEVLFSILMLTTEPERAERISKIVSFLAVLVMWIAAVYILIYFDSNPSLFLLAVYLFISVFLKSEWHGKRH